jgi:hypothetical protein
LKDTIDMPLHSLMLDSTIENIRHSLERHMPLSQQRDFYLWGTSPENPLQDTFLYAMSVPQLINLSAYLLEDMVAPEHWKKLARYTGRLNTYFMYEIVSDDLAIGLSPLAVADTTYPLRLQILYAFNHVMVDRLSGEPTDTADILEPLKPLTRSVSGFTQSMTREKRDLILRSYLKQQPSVSSSNIEYGIWPILVANIDLCHELAESVYKLDTGWMVRQGFIDRYQSVTELLESQSILPLSELANIGTRSILVVPTLAYYIGILSKIQNSEKELSPIVSDGTLADALSTAALLVRLLNDIGLPLTLSGYERAKLINALWDHYEMHPQASGGIAHLLVSASENPAFQAQFGDAALLTRLHKDAAAGEFNICLHNLAYAESVGDGLNMLEGNLTYFAELYQQANAHLQKLLGDINTRSKSPTISTLVQRFVQFYALLYAKPYKTSAGEYVA